MTHRTLTTAVLLVAATLSVGCTNKRMLEDFIDLTVENQSNAQLWYFNYADCGSDRYTAVIASDEYVADGDSVSAYGINPGCYDLYVEDEYGCYADNSTDTNVEGGMVFTWTITEDQLFCLW